MMRAFAYFLIELLTVYMSAACGLHYVGPKIRKVHERK